MKRIVGLLILCSLSIASYSQLDFDALKRRSEARLQERKNVWDEFLDARKEAWGRVIANRDLEWTDFLSGSEWTLYTDFLTNEIPERPKPVVVPKVDVDIPVRPQPEPVAIDEVTVVQSMSVVEELPVNIDSLPCKPVEVELIDDINSVRFDFFGRKCSIPIDQRIKTFRKSKYGQKEIAEFWKTVSEYNYTSTVKALLEKKEEMGLNDWGYYILVSRFSGEMYSDRNCALLLTWFMMTRSGLDVRTGYNNDGVVLLLPTGTTLYGLNYLNIDERKYYIVANESNTGIYTYRGNYADGHQLEFGQRRPLRFGEDSIRSLSFTFQDKEYSFEFNFDSGLIDYYNSLPLAQYEIFFEASPSSQLKKSIETNLKPIVEEMDKPTALNFLLQFVQLAFAYETDQEQFGTEKYFYADELFYYPYCDCEDRAVLFSYLVHELMGYDVIGTEYPGHMATAVALDYEVSGVRYNVEGRIYTIADPTYLRSTVGQCMSQFGTTIPTVHKIVFAE